MNRRDFMRRMFGLTITIAVNPSIIIPKLASDKLYGIDWGVNDGTYGTWLGIKRSDSPIWSAKVPAANGAIRQDLFLMIKKMMDDAVDKHWQIILGTEEQMKKFNKL